MSLKYSMTDSIPVIGTAVVNGVSWIQRQIASIDFAVDQYIVINNGRPDISPALYAAMSVDNPLVRSKSVIDLPGNIGCAGAWNLMIKTTMDRPYWIICNHDVAFVPGLLEAMHTSMQQPDVGLVHGSPGNIGWGSWDLFAIRDRVVQSHGLFDENFYPAYAEDLDYIMRLIKDPVRQVMLDFPYLHGLGTNSDYGKQGSQTWREEPHLKAAIDHGRYINETEYMTNKWGASWRWLDPSALPRDQMSGRPSQWTWDLDFCRRKHLGF